MEYTLGLAYLFKALLHAAKVFKKPFFTAGS